ncbi:hypothetical protein A2Z33_01935 [Candidatus Gottesmanbacteria bacterium RBG_16_52_11]|uniref:Major facilitator superfamily (MFS) profile domain-containing protein n=1 Tax=Candidatus Gottesmanbacteria bacterium RBG_16_52_11 TaxID=1798374 RepID=A0A1F5YQY9_9BACT|nr:MAG: hypothetical protein A2Z33_01935 [Candidatus Gottesmanbacteria bacterium RBG_16_52_11]
MIIGLIVSAVSLVVFGSATNGMMIAVAAIIGGVGEAFYFGANMALLYDALKAFGRQKDFAAIRANCVLSAQAGIIIGGVIGGYLYTVAKGLPYFANAASLLLCAVAVSGMFESRVHAAAIRLHDTARTIANGFRETFRQGHIRRLSAYYIMVGGITWTWQIYLNQIFASEIGYGEVAKGWLFAGVRLMNALVLIGLARATGFSKRRIFYYFPLIMLISTFPALIPNAYVNTFLLFTMTLSASSRFTFLDAVVNDEVSSTYRATVLSTLNLFVRIIHITGVTLAGPIIDAAGSKWVYALGGIVTLSVILPLAAVLARPKAEAAAVPALTNLDEGKT